MGIDTDSVMEDTNDSTISRAARSRQSGRPVTAFGETKSIADWSRDKRCRVAYATLYSRIVRARWAPEIAISTGTDRRLVRFVDPARE